MDENGRKKHLITSLPTTLLKAISRRKFLGRLAAGAGAVFAANRLAAPRTVFAQGNAAAKEARRVKRVALTRKVTEGLPLSELFTRPLDELIPKFVAKLPSAVSDGIITQNEVNSITGLIDDFSDALELAYTEVDTETGRSEDIAVPSIQQLMTQDDPIDETVRSISTALVKVGFVVPWAELKETNENVNRPKRKQLFDGTFPDHPDPRFRHPRDYNNRKLGILHQRQLGTFTIDDLYTESRRRHEGPRTHLIAISRESGLLGTFQKNTGGPDDPETKVNDRACSGNVCVSNSGTYCELAEGGGCNSLSDPL